MQTGPLRIALVNMPFAKLSMPSLALAQLEQMLISEFGDRVSVSVHYVNIDFALKLGSRELYDFPHTNPGVMTNAGDWYFSEAAFPGKPDTAEAYYARFFPGADGQTSAIRGFLETDRERIEVMLDELMEENALAEADIAGFTAFFAQTTASFAMARRLKLRNPEITTIMGGPACEGEASAVFAERVPQVDYFFSGPGLASVREFVKQRLGGDAPAGIPGVFSGSETDDVPLVGEETDINANLVPDYAAFLEKFDRAFPDREIEPILTFETSRGCSWGERLACKFCGMSNTMMRFRQLTPENTIKQFEALFGYADRVSMFASVDNIPPDDFVSEVVPHLRPPDHVRIKYHVRPIYEKGELEALCKAGITKLNPGIEALNSETLKLMSKGTSAFRVIRFLRDASEFPLDVEWSILIFSPGEPVSVYEKYLRDIPLLTHLQPPASVHPVLIPRFSEYFQRPDDYGLRIQPQEHFRMIYPFPEEDIARSAYYFENMDIDHEQLHHWLSELQGAVGYWRARWGNTDGREEARLCLAVDDDGGCVVYDSRGGRAKEVPLSEPAFRLLAQLDQPATAGTLATRFRDAGEMDVESEIEYLAGNDLLFEEKGRYLSLVTNM